ncbi:thioesterase II family protein [Nocardiopsis baichengensis]|uniref:thioesterase II family protein n=1 Tax=Nocardiopsis baichengensis TaxID=280240 RepID=UPI000345B519|nr:alpha/beta fold hydrolase [Nocardiopsis baichengensis]
MNGDADLWLQCTAPDSGARMRLICLPHAGGSASFYREWGTRMPGIEVHAVRYPGRAERIAEPAPWDLRALARGIADAVETLSDRPFALFGHSMGAAVGLEAARALEARGAPPAHLFASGSRDAPYPSPEAAPDEDDAELLRRLVALGGTDPEIAESPEFQELVLPYVRSDGRMFHDYVPRDEPPLACPVTTIVGDADTEADRRPWSRLTTGRFCERRVSGGHFYLTAAPPFAEVRQALDLPSRPSAAPPWGTALAPTSPGPTSSGGERGVGLR